MTTKVIMPQMGESVVEGTILKWLKREGERVARDESLVEVHTEKVDVEIPSPVAGVLTQILAQEGETIPVGQEIALIEEADKKEAPPAEGLATVLSKDPKVKVAETEIVRANLLFAQKDKDKDKEEKVLPHLPQELPPESGPRRITPVVARMAGEYGLDLGKVMGTGLGGRVTRKDLLDYLARRKEDSPPKPPSIERTGGAPVEIPPVEGKPTQEAEGSYDSIPLKGMRKAIADHMVLSKRTSPHVTTVLEVDMTRLVDFRNRHKEEFQREEGIPLTYMSFIVKAVVNALKKHPLLNSSIEGDRILVKHFYNIGVAVALEEGLIVPVVQEADKKGVRELARAIHDLATRGRMGKLTPADLQGGTFSITNPGIFGAIISTPIIHQPQAAILGVEAIRKMPVVRNDEIVIRSLMFLCLSYDHRIVDGATAIRFLQQVRKALENPLELIL